MPRRNSNAKRRNKPRVEAAAPNLGPSYETMALRLVEAGVRPPSILESHRPITRATNNRK